MEEKFNPYQSTSRISPKLFLDFDYLCPENNITKDDAKTRMDKVVNLISHALLKKVQVFIMIKSFYEERLVFLEKNLNKKELASIEFLFDYGFLNKGIYYCSGTLSAVSFSRECTFLTSESEERIFQASTRIYGEEQAETILVQAMLICRLSSEHAMPSLEKNPIHKVFFSVPNGKMYSSLYRKYFSLNHAVSVHLFSFDNIQTLKPLGGGDDQGDMFNESLTENAECKTPAPNRNGTYHRLQASFNFLSYQKLKNGLSESESESESEHQADCLGCIESNQLEESIRMLTLPNSEIGEDADKAPKP